MIEQGIENIIFDLGGVILDIDYQLTAQAFKDLGLTDFDELYSQASQTDLFDNFEKGLVSPSHFVNSLLHYMPSGTTPNQVVAAWNAIVIGFPKENLELLKKLKSKYRIFLLSNTNEIHVQHFTRRLSQTVSETSLDPFFEKVYYSSDIHMRKPNADIFDKVCDDNQLDRSKTVFIDDSIQHIEGAKKTGLNTFHFDKGANQFFETFKSAL